jgi:hypothetical protein
VARTALALKVAEQALHEVVENAKVGDVYVDAMTRIKIALEAIQPLAMAYNDEVAEKRSPLTILHMDLNSIHMHGSMPHWAMNKIATSLAESMLEAPNYMTATIVTGKADGPRFEMLLRQIGKGKTCHELRLEAEKRTEEAERRLDALLSGAHV